MRGASVAIPEGKIASRTWPLCREIDDASSDDALDMRPRISSPRAARRTPSSVSTSPRPTRLHEHRARLGLESLEVVGDGGLAVVEGLGGGRCGAVLGQRHEHLEPVDVDHGSIISMASMVMVDNLHWTDALLVREYRSMEKLTVDGVYAAAEVLRDLLPPTPAWSYPVLDAAVGARAIVKHENVQPTGAFKVRGGLNLLATLSPAERAAGLITVSTGNHAQSLAYAAARSGRRRHDRDAPHHSRRQGRRRARVGCPRPARGRGHGPGRGLRGGPGRARGPALCEPRQHARDRLRPRDCVFGAAPGAPRDRDAVRARGLRAPDWRGRCWCATRSRLPLGWWACRPRAPPPRTSRGSPAP